MKRLSGSNQEIAALLYAEQLELSQQNDNVEEAVAAIIQDVRLRGDEALRHYSATFDRVELEHFEVGQDLVDQAFEQVDQAVLTALENAKANIESYHRQQIEKGFAMYIYDYKFPDLSEIAYNHLLHHLDAYKVKPQFYVINFDDSRKSHRCNPINPAFMTDISDAYESAYTIMLNLNKTWV